MTHQIHKAQESNYFETTAVAFVAGVIATVLFLWAVNIATNGIFLQSFMGSNASTDYDEEPEDAYEYIEYIN